jgi:hypothetical protein
VAEQGANQVRLDLMLSPPSPNGPSQVVRRASGNARPGAGGGDVAADVATGQEEEAGFSPAVLEERNRNRLRARSASTFGSSCLEARQSFIGHHCCNVTGELAAPLGDLGRAAQSTLCEWCCAPPLRPSLVDEGIDGALVSVRT